MFKIGHPVYSGANAPANATSPHLAVMVLIQRGVEPTVARAKVNEARTYPYPHIVMSTKGDRDVIELIYHRPPTPWSPEAMPPYVYF